MPPVGPCSRRDLIKRFRSLGWEGPVRGRQHDFMVLQRRKVRIPNDHAGDISVGLVREILRQADISAEAWDKAG